jgi:hypothetical protein
MWRTGRSRQKTDSSRNSILNVSVPIDQGNFFLPGGEKFVHHGDRTAPRLRLDRPLPSSRPPHLRFRVSMTAGCTRLPPRNSEIRRTRVSLQQTGDVVLMGDTHVLSQLDPVISFGGISHVRRYTRPRALIPQRHLRVPQWIVAVEHGDDAASPQAGRGRGRSRFRRRHLRGRPSRRGHLRCRSLTPRTSRAGHVHFGLIVRGCAAAACRLHGSASAT